MVEYRCEKRQQVQSLEAIPPLWRTAFPGHGASAGCLVPGDEQGRKDGSSAPVMEHTHVR